MSLKDSVVVGGLDMTAQAKELARRPHVVIATPGRLRALMQLDAALARAFARTRFLVLDEADRLLEPSFEGELAVVLGALPARRQTLLFSATMTQTLTELQGQLLQDAYHFQVGGRTWRGVPKLPQPPRVGGRRGPSRTGRAAPLPSHATRT
jgi:ATP-dependent RNA helicase DDX49/DBP8